MTLTIRGLLVGAALSLTGSDALALDCDRVNHTDGKRLCRAILENSSDGWVPRADFDSSACTSIKLRKAKAFCQAIDEGGQSNCARTLDVGIYPDSDIRAMCAFFQTFGRRMRSHSDPDRLCSLDDDALDAFCDAMGKSEASLCSKVPSGDERRTCLALTNVLSLFWALEPSLWAKAKTVVMTEVDRERRESEVVRAILIESSALAIEELPPEVARTTRSREEYAEAWAAHQGRDMTPEEARTLMRGCIGITSVNLGTTGNPIDVAEEMYDDLGKALTALANKNALLDWFRQKSNPAAAWLLDGKKPREGRYVLFAKLYWSNQNRFLDDTERDVSDPARFPADPDTHEVDVENFRRRYAYMPRPGANYINYDYGFWDEGAQAFWHANHMEHLDEDDARDDPMVVYQSKPAKFVRGYVDFDATVFGIAFTESFDPRSTATFWGNKLAKERD